ncbi:hypothetical protein AHAS_Ahas13G0344700 [Arachis hypogaea]
MPLEHLGVARQGTKKAKAKAGRATWCRRRGTSAQDSHLACHLNAGRGTPATGTKANDGCGTLTLGVARWLYFLEREKEGQLYGRATWCRRQNDLKDGKGNVQKWKESVKWSFEETGIHAIAWTTRSRARSEEAGTRPHD